MLNGDLPDFCCSSKFSNKKKHFVSTFSRPSEILAILEIINIMFSFSEARVAQLFQGDIELDDDDRSIINRRVNISSSSASKRNVISFRRKIWRTRVIPYEIIHPGTKKHSTGINKNVLDVYS